MERWNIVAAVVTDKEFENVDQWIAAAPDRFIPGAGILDPTTVAVEDLRKDFLGGRFRVMGEIAAQYTGYGADDHRVKPYFDLAAELDVPVLVHSAGLAGPAKRFRLALGSPLRLEDTLVRHPGLRVYFENAGWPYLEDMLALMYRYPNVYADVSTITWVIPRRAFHAYLRGLIEGGVAKRIMFGSDQMHWPEVIDAAVDAIESADFLTEKQKRDIFYNNAARFLRFGQDKVEEDHSSNQ